ncbi:hypothetical protein [Delftia sp. WSY_7]|uniref:hypothetical protein n=1 Tax=Delftia sp. WSY_7 TaxID=3367202 RepID=UPI00370A5624
MSDWESNFGSGVSAEGVIGSINAWNSYEEREEMLRIKEERSLNSMAFRSDPDIKLEFLEKFKSLCGIGDLIAEDRDLNKIFSQYDDAISELEVNYRIPKDLVLLANMIFTGLRNERRSSMATVKDDAEAAQWLCDFFDSIVPGTDLRFIGQRFKVTLASAALACLQGTYGNENKDCGRIAYDILCVQARGVKVQSELVEVVKRVLSKQFEFSDIDFALQCGWDRSSLGFLILWFLLDEQLDMAAEVGAVERVYNVGDGGRRMIWWRYARKLIELVKVAPAQRIKLIDLNSLERLAGSFDKS